MQQFFNLIFIFIFCNALAQKTDFNHISFKKADLNALNFKDESLENIPLLAYNLTHNLTTDAEKFRAIYKWVTTSVSNDFNLSDLNESKQNTYINDSIKLKAWNTKISIKLYKQLLKNKSTICTGYAYLIKSLCNYANIKSQIVHGYGKLSTTNLKRFESPNHSWNAVLLNNKWYLADATWASGKQNEETLEFEFDYSDGYFLTEPKLFAINHFPVQKKWLLLNETDYKFDDFLNAPMVYKNGFNYLNCLLSQTKLNNHIKTKSDIDLRYTFKAPIAREDIKLEIDSGYTYVSVAPYLKTGSKNSLSIHHNFKNKGQYDVHLKYKNKYLASYTFYVTE